MDSNKVELYRQVFHAFKQLCAEGKQNCSFNTFCREHGVSQCQMRLVLKEEFQNVTSIPGYKRFCRNPKATVLYSHVYDEFKQLCAVGKQPGTFASYYSRFGITRKQMSDYLHKKGLKVSDLPGFVGPSGIGNRRYKEVPFENVIFEEAGFLPAGDSNVITVRVDGHVEVSFPADTDIDVISKFVKKARKEVGNVGA